MTSATLKKYTCKDLAQMAKKRGVRGWHSMRKDQLVRALVKASKSNSSVRRTKSSKKKSPARKTSRSSATRARKRISQLSNKLEHAKNLGSTNGKAKTARERLVVMVRDPYWLHAYWELSQQSVERVRAAMGQYWHAAKPVLRVYEVTGAGESLRRTIEIHGGVNNWYIDVCDPPKSYRLEIGYLADGEKFHAIARSNKVTTPSPASRDSLDQNWADVAENFDRIYAMSGGYSQENQSGELKDLLEERLRRPMGAPLVTRYGAGAEALIDNRKDFEFEVDAEMIIFGSTKPNAHVTLMGEPVPLRPDGTFTVRMHMPDKRQVIPVVANSCDGVEQRTIVVAVERNIKMMEPVIHEPTD